MAGGTRIGVVQIAGLIARRIVDFAATGDQLRAGQRFGLIRFGSGWTFIFRRVTMPRPSSGSEPLPERRSWRI